MQFKSTRLHELERRLSARYPTIRVCEAELRIYEDGSSYQVIRFFGYPEQLIGYGLAVRSRRDPLSFDALDECGTGAGETLEVAGYVLHHTPADESFAGPRLRWPTKRAAIEVRRIWYHLASLP